MDIKNSRHRFIDKKDIKWARIERDFTRVSSDGTIEKTMDRKTIAKYFKHLEEKGLITLNENDNHYYLTLLEDYEANLIECKTLNKLMNVF